MNENTRSVLMKRFEIILNKLSMQVYLKINTDKQGKLYKKHRPYSLSQDTMQAKELYNILFFNDTFKNMSIDQEEQIKGYLLTNRKLWQEN